MAGNGGHGQRQRRESELAESWRDGSVQVDGVAIPARLLTHDDTDVGIATFSRDGQGVMVIAEGIDLDTLTLVGWRTRIPSSASSSADGEGPSPVNPVGDDRRSNLAPTGVTSWGSVVG